MLILLWNNAFPKITIPLSLWRIICDVFCRMNNTCHLAQFPLLINVPDVAKLKEMQVPE